MKLISWNVNGLRACREKGFEAFFAQEDADFFCIQETKLQEGQIKLELPGYNQYWHYADKKGYSGTAVFTKHTPLSVQRDFGLPAHNGGGRVLTLEYPDFLPGECLCAQLQAGAAAAGLPDGVGGCPAAAPVGAGRQETGDLLR